MATSAPRDLARGSDGAPLATYAAVGGLVLCAAWLMRPQVLGDWDSWEYAADAVRGKCSGLCLGRWWFSALMIAAWRFGDWLGVRPLQCHLPLAIAVSLMTALGAAALTHWSYLVTGRRRAAAMAGVVIAGSPVLAAYGSAVMTEGPALLLLSLALVGWELAVDPARRARLAWAMLAGAAFGASANMREPILMLGVWPVASCLVDRPAGRWRLLAAACVGAAATFGAGVAMAMSWLGQTLGQTLAGYWEYMAAERATYGKAPLTNLVYLLGHLALVMPLGVLAFALKGAGRLAGRRDAKPQAAPARRLTALAASTVPYALFTWFNPDLPFNYRLVLPLAWMLAPCAGATANDLLEELGAGRWRPWAKALPAALAGAAMLAAVAPPVLGYHRHNGRLGAFFFHCMLELPPDSAIIGGSATAPARYIRYVQPRENWRELVTGFDASPEGLAQQVRAQFAAGRRVFVNVMPQAWARMGQPTPEWTATQAMLQTFAHRQAVGAFVELLDDQSPAGQAALAPQAKPADGEAFVDMPALSH